MPENWRIKFPKKVRYTCWHLINVGAERRGSWESSKSGEKIGTQGEDEVKRNEEGV